jgi:8-oxo-dGTP pyrophosphatase MutT (NUDIX family)
MICCFIVRPSAIGGFEILQLRREPADYMGGTWATVYGQIEKDETAIVAALRELREEAGLIPKEFFRLERVNSFFIPGTDTLWHCVQFCAIVAVDAEVLLNAEHDAFRWTSIGSAESEFIWQNDVTTIAEIQTQILRNSPAKPYLRIALSDH